MTGVTTLDLLLLALDAALVLAASVHIVFNKRQPRSAVLWLIVVWLAPFLGFLLYWYFGYNRVRARSIRRSLPSPRPVLKGRFRPLDRLGAALTGSPLSAGNRIELLENGAQAYPAMLKAIGEAKSQVDLLTYIFDVDPVGERFVEALSLASHRGVAVRVLVDGIGAWVPLTQLRRRLSSSKVRLASFWRTDHLFHQPLVNLRNHRKLLIVDSRLAFTGGLNISERHHKGPLAISSSGPLRKRDRGIDRDLHFGVKGPVGADIQAAFDADWSVSTRARGAAAAAAPARRHSGTDMARVVASGPDLFNERIYELLLGALRVARTRVDICTPYFIPDVGLLAMLRLVAMSGVRVRLIVPGTSDHSFMTWASRAYYLELLDAGIEIWQIKGGFVHTKAIVVDSRWCFIGSCNLDPRSFRLNFELNLETYSQTLAREILRVMEAYRREAFLLDMAFLRRTPFLISLRNHVAKLFSPYL